MVEHSIFNSSTFILSTVVNFRQVALFVYVHSSSIFYISVRFSKFSNFLLKSGCNFQIIFSYYFMVKHSIFNSATFILSTAIKFSQMALFVYVHSSSIFYFSVRLSPFSKFLLKNCCKFQIIFSYCFMVKQSIFNSSTFILTTVVNFRQVALFVYVHSSSIFYFSVRFLQFFNILLKNWSNFLDVKNR